MFRSVAERSPTRPVIEGVVVGFWMGDDVGRGRGADPVAGRLSGVGGFAGHPG